MMEEKENQEGIELPAPTLWPMLAAFGMMLGFAGLVTDPIVSATGITLFFISGYGWWREVLPRQHEEKVALPPEELRAKPAQPTSTAVEVLSLGEGGHRKRLPERVFPLSAGIQGGIAGGIAMAVMAEIFGLLAFDSLWYPVNLLAASALPELANADTAALETFNATGLIVAVIVHVLLSLLMGLLYAVLLPMFPRSPAIVGGFVAPILWTSLLWTSLGVINPALADRVAWSWFAASQIAFGLVAGYVISRSEKIETMQSEPVAVRAGLEAQEPRGEDDQ
ncbi:MAG: hypothetical protein VX252_01020 [Myxococcota bacterium]|nr:hypothetical protein [Myxococcota bacterium]